MATAKKTGDKPVKPKAPAAPKVAAVVKPKPAAGKPATASKAGTGKAPAKATKAAQPSGAKVVKAAAPQRALAPDQRRYYIEVAAYYIAERRGFHGDSQLDDWVAAEEEIDRLLRAGILNP